MIYGYPSIGAERGRWKWSDLVYDKSLNNYRWVTKNWFKAGSNIFQTWPNSFSGWNNLYYIWTLCLTQTTNSKECSRPSSEITWPKRSWILSGCFVHRWRFTIFPVYRWVVHNSQIGVKNKNMFILFRANSWRSILTDECDSLNGSKNNNLRQIVDNFLYQTDSKTWTYRV